MYENPVIVLNNSTQVFVCSTLIYSENMRIVPPKKYMIRKTKWETNQLSCTIVFFLHKLDSQYTTSTPKYTYKYQPIDKYVNLCVYVLNVPKDIIDFESGKSFMCS